MCRERHTRLRCLPGMDPAIPGPLRAKGANPFEIPRSFSGLAPSV